MYGFYMEAKKCSSTTKDNFPYPLPPCTKAPGLWPTQRSTETTLGHGAPTAYGHHARVPVRRAGYIPYEQLFNGDGWKQAAAQMGIPVGPTQLQPLWANPQFNLVQLWFNASCLAVSSLFSLALHSLDASSHLASEFINFAHQWLIGLTTSVRQVCAIAANTYWQYITSLYWSVLDTLPSQQVFLSFLKQEWVIFLSVYLFCSCLALSTAWLSSDTTSMPAKTPVFELPAGHKTPRRSNSPLIQGGTRVGQEVDLGDAGYVAPPAHPIKPVRPASTPPDCVGPVKVENVSEEMPEAVQQAPCTLEVDASGAQALEALMRRRGRTQSEAATPGPTRRSARLAGRATVRH